MGTGRGPEAAGGVLPVEGAVPVDGAVPDEGAVSWVPVEGVVVIG